MKISIVTPSYNSAKTIRRTLESIEAQEYRNFEHIIIDGASKDETLNYIQTFSSPIRRVQSQPDKGIYDAMNKGIDMASGDIIAILNSDDFFANKYVLQDIVNLFKQGADIVYGGQYFCSPNGDLTSSWIPTEYQSGSFSRGWHTPHPAFFARAELYKAYGNFNLKYPVAADYDLMLRFMNKSHVISSHLPQILTIVQNDGNSSKLINIIKGAKDIYHSMKENGIPFNTLFFAFRRYIPKILRKFRNCSFNT